MDTDESKFTVIFIYAYVFIYIYISYFRIYLYLYLCVNDEYRFSGEFVLLIHHIHLDGASAPLCLHAPRYFVPADAPLDSKT